MEGGSYVWTTLAFGRGVAAVNALVYWVSNPIWVGGTLGITALTAFREFFNSGNRLPGPKIFGGASTARHRGYSGGSRPGSARRSR